MSWSRPVKRTEHSDGFRSGRRAHDAVLAAQTYVQSGRRVVVDVDLEKSFDRVNHDTFPQWYDALGRYFNFGGDVPVLSQPPSPASGG